MIITNNINHQLYNMQAVILAGGLGSRLKPYTITIPKPLLPLGDYSILEIVTRQLAAAGIRRIALTLGHLQHLFAATFADGKKYGVEIDYYIEEEPMGTAGSLRLIKDLEEDFIVMNGDILTTLNYRELFKLHVSKKAWGTIALNKRKVDIDYGVVQYSDEGWLQDYIEKPSLPYSVSMGVYVLSRKCLEFIPEKGKFDMPQLMLAMHKAGKQVLCFSSDCYWQDIGRFDDYQQASSDFINNPELFLPAKRG